MFERTVSPEDLGRRRQEREDADRRYNEALTALDRAVPRAPDPPHPPPGPDEHQAAALNERWRLVPEEGPPRPGGWLRGRLARFVWGVIGPYIERQQAFNAALVDHVNRNLPAQHETRRAIESTIATLGDQAAALAAFHSHLIVHLQQFTPYVDTKDREHAALARRVHEDNRDLIELAMHRTIGLAGAISGVGEELLMRWDSMLARDHRYEARVESLAHAHEQLRQVAALAQQTSLTMKRELERALSGGGLPAAAPVRAQEAAAAAGAPATTASGPARSWQQAGADTIDAFKYVGFEERFRGSREDIRARLEQYLPLFDGASNVLDVGCGRGEFLELLAARGLRARGIDVNHEMVEACRARGLEVVEGDVVSHLQALEDGELGGLIAVQVVEHLEPDYLVRFLDLAYHKLAAGASIVLETINPGCWFAFFESYIRDITHVRPIHPDTLSYYLAASGFQDVSVRYSEPYPEHQKLQPVPADTEGSEVLNANAERLNRLLFTYMDYAAIGKR
jgi:2-polyprenyl-3-methyl-5-hydroxy-6-metoxy-1,4-benzoquinol methylase